MPSLNSIAAPYALYQPLSDQSKTCGYDQFSQPLHSDLTLVKHKHKAAGGSSSDHQQLSLNAAAFSRAQKVLTLEKYREKHAAELALQNGMKDELGADMYASPAVTSHHHKKRSQPQQSGQSGDGRREKASSKKPRLPASYTENSSAMSEELKMRIKVSSERHGGSEQSGTLSGKDKHKSHRHSKHGHSHSSSVSGNGRGTMDNVSLSARAPSSHSSDGGFSSSSRKRPHSDADNHHHHHHHHSSTKSSRSSKGGLSSSHYSDGSQRMMEHHGHDGTNGVLMSNGQHTDYKNTFDMLDSLLSAQGMNL